MVKKESAGQEEQGKKSNLRDEFDKTEEDKSKKDDIIDELENSEETKKEELNKEEEELNTRYMRLAADFQNYKRRVEKERSNIYAYANEKIVVELLDVIDNFERALDHSKGHEDSFSEGMSLIFTQFKGVLEKNGVSEIASLGQDFDPNYHNAVMTENSVEYDSGKVSQVLQKGYTLNDKVIRPSMVKVAE